jgi:hypothetical protein
MVDVARVDSGAEARAVHGLAGAGDDFPEGDGMFVIRFLASWPGLFRASFGARTTEDAARLGSSLVLPEPFLGTGYTAYAPAAVPEFWMELSEAPIGAEIWHLAEVGGEGYEKGLARFAGRYSGWRSYPAAEERGLTPGGVPEASAGSVARGVGVVDEGGTWPADFGPNAGELTAYRTSGDGSVTARRLTDGQCEQVFHRRLLTTWRGAPFEVLALGAETATLVLTSGNAEEATRLGLDAAGRHAWRAQAPKAQLGELTEETRTIGVQPQFG